MTNTFKAKLKSGDKASWSHLFGMYIDVLYKYGSHLIQEEDALKDCIQDVFLSLYERKDTIDVIGNMRAYLLKALRNNIINYQKFKSRQAEQRTNWHDYGREISQYPFEEAEAKISEKRAVKFMLYTLTKRDRELLILRFYKGFDHERISIICGIKKQTVSNAIHKALKTLNLRFKSFWNRD